MADSKNFRRILYWKRLLFAFKRIPIYGKLVDKFSRKTQIAQMLKQQKFLFRQGLADMFSCSVKTIVLDMKQLNDDGGLPNYYDEQHQVFRLDTHQYIEVQGLWFSHEELHALLLIQQLTAKLAGGSLDMKPLSDKISNLLNKMSVDAEDILRFRVFHVGSRAKNMPNFGIVSQALLSRDKLDIVYNGRAKNKTSERIVSPQRMVFYKGNWYLDAWCHKASALRSFAVERIIEAKELGQPCREIAEKTLDKHFTRTFGIYSGEPTHTAILHFSQKVALWVEDEEWFPNTRGIYLESGKYELRIPYSNPTELIMEICKHGGDVKVIEPPELCRQVAKRLQQAADQYR